MKISSKFCDGTRASVFINICLFYDMDLWIFAFCDGWRNKQCSHTFVLVWLWQYKVQNSFIYFEFSINCKGWPYISIKISISTKNTSIVFLSISCDCIVIIYFRIVYRDSTICKHVTNKGGKSIRHSLITGNYLSFSPFYPFFFCFFSTLARINKNLNYPSIFFCSFDKLFYLFLRSNEIPKI